MAFFEGKGMTGGYGGVDIITSCTINVNQGEIVAILGPNGAGKSTAMKAMLGLLELKSGTVTIDGKDSLYATSGGYADIKKESVSLVLETSENASNIDISRSEEAIKRAAKHLKNPNEDLNRAKKAIERAKVRISVAKTLTSSFSKIRQ